MKTSTIFAIGLLALAQICSALSPAWVSPGPECDCVMVSPGPECDCVMVSPGPECDCVN